MRARPLLAPVALLASLSALVASARSAQAWGLGAPVGPAGTISCTGKAPPPDEAPVGRFGVAGGWTRSSLLFDGDVEATVEKVAVVGTTDFFTGGSTSFQLAAGGFLAGTLEAGGIERDMGPGWLASGSATWRVVDGTGAAPYVLLTLTLGATGTRTFVDPPEAGDAPLRGSYLAFDARFGAAVGKTFFDRVSPYAAVRAFGGPVIWSEGDTTRNGTDRYHVQLAAGAALLLDPVDVFVEGAPLGEQAITGGVGLRF